MNYDYDVSVFIDAMKGRSLVSILQQIEWESDSSMRAATGRGSPEARKKGCVQYSMALGELQGFIMTGEFSHRTHQYHARLFRDLMRDLVDRGQLAEMPPGIDDQIERMPF